MLGAGLTYEWTRNQVGEVVPVRGASMQPTLNPSYEEVDVANKRHALLQQDRVVVRHLTLGLGDVVTCVDPHDRRQALIKRVVGVVETRRYSQRFCHIPEGHCWIEGDNQADNVDNNDFGPVPMGLLKGKALAVVRPWKKM